MDLYLRSGSFSTRPDMERIGGHNATSATFETIVSRRPTLWSPMIPLTFSEAVSPSSRRVRREP
jgi:hypothetical protein